MELAVDAEKVPDRPFICEEFSKEVLEGLDTGKIMDASFPKHIEKHRRDNYYLLLLLCIYFHS